MTAPALAAPAQCASFIGARRVRVTRVDACGRPLYGPKSQVVSSGFVSVEISPEVEEGEDYSTKTAGGDLCISEKGQDNLKWMTIGIEFCQVDPDMFTAMNPTWKPVTNGDRSQSTGFRIGQKFSDTAGFALELWPKAAGAGASCLDEDDGAVDPDFEVNGYFLLPWVLGTAPDSWTLENGAATFKLQGRTKAGSLWGAGPYPVTRDADGAPAALLDPIDPGFDVPQWDFVSTADPDHFHAEIVTVRPPAASCGARPLYNPSAIAPTVTVTGSGTSRTAQVKVGNFADVGRSGTVNWGDGTAQPVPTSSNGTVSHSYDKDDTFTIAFIAGNGAEPVTSEFVAKQPAD